MLEGVSQADTFYVYVPRGRSLRPSEAGLPRRVGRPDNILRVDQGRLALRPDGKLELTLKNAWNRHEARLFLGPSQVTPSSAPKRAIAALEKTDSALRLNVQFKVLSLDGV